MMHLERRPFSCSVFPFVIDMAALLRCMAVSETSLDYHLLGIQGFQYELGDFWLRVGKVASIHSESLRGIVVEMEYLSISSWVTSHQLMGEFFDIWNEAIGKRSLPGHFVHFEPKFSEYGLSDQYTSEHTDVQYASTIAQMIAATESSQAV